MDGCWFFHRDTSSEMPNAASRVYMLKIVAAQYCGWLLGSSESGGSEWIVGHPDKVHWWKV
jgi:hypothetical protein